MSDGCRGDAKSHALVGHGDEDDREENDVCIIYIYIYIYIYLYIYIYIYIYIYVYHDISYRTISYGIMFCHAILNSIIPYCMVLFFLSLSLSIYIHIPL